MAQGWTPGPWRADEKAIPEPGGGSARYVRSESRHWSICVVHETAGCSDSSLDITAHEAEANAYLGASAPRLYEALETLLREYKAWAFHFDNDDGTAEALIRDTRAALSAARGDA